MRWILEACQGFGEGAGGIDAAGANLLLPFGGPAVGGDVCAGEVNGGGEAFKRLGVERGFGWVPQQLIGALRGAPDELEDREATIIERLAQNGAEHTGGSGEQDVGWARVHFDDVNCMFPL